MIRRIVLATLILISFSNFGQTINQVGFYNVNGVMGVSCKDNYMILSDGKIIDNTVPASPTLIGQYDAYDNGRVVISSGDYAYFGASQKAMLEIVDISNMLFPIQESSIDFKIGNGIWGLDISENTLFVSLGDPGIICSVSVENKNKPVVLDTLIMPDGPEWSILIQSWDLVVENNHVFFADLGGLRTIDISNPSHLQLISTIGSGYSSVETGDSLAFAGKRSGGVDVYNISDPAHPFLIFSIANDGGDVLDLKFDENYLYITTNLDGMYIYEIVDDSCIETAHFLPKSENEQSFGVCVQDSLVIWSSLVSGVTILQIGGTVTDNNENDSGSNGTLNEIGYYNANSLMGIACKDEYLILSNGEIVDNTIPSFPTKIGQFTFSGDGSSILTRGDYAYFGMGMTNALLIADISNVASPVENGSIYFTIGNGVFGMDISENTLFVALGNNGILCSIDVSDKNNPVILDTLYLTGAQSRDVVIQDNYAFVANGLGLKIIDISDASHLQLMTSIGSGYNSIDIGDNLVFLGKSSGGVDVYDISEPLNPAPAFSIANSSGTAWDLQYHKNHLYLATNNDGLFMYKIEDNSGTEMANFPNTGNGQSFGVCVQDSLILLTGQRNGVAILQYDTTGTVGINNIYLKDHLNIFPNPARDYIFIENNTSPIYKINIFNISGNLVKQINQDRSIRKINITDLFKGQYIIQAITDDKILVQKFIKL